MAIVFVPGFSLSFSPVLTASSALDQQTITFTTDHGISETFSQVLAVALTELGWELPIPCDLPVTESLEEKLEKHHVQKLRANPPPTFADPSAAIPPGVNKNYLSFPFVVSRDTVRSLRRSDSRVMFMMRGLSGSGKSTVVNTLKALYGAQAVVCSADNFFFTEDGEYKFDEKLLSAAHSTCQQKAKDECQRGTPIVIIDNTNVKKWEMKFYLAEANRSGYVVVLVEPKTPWKWNAVELSQRNNHGVPLEVLRRKVNAYDDIIPSYYAWFINSRMSQKLSKLCSCLFMQCLSTFPALKREMLQELRIKPNHIDEETAYGILSEYFSKSARSSPLLHCTSRFCGRGKSPGSSSYHQRRDVQAACGQCFCLTITAVVITKRTLSLRVSLDGGIKSFFDRPEEKDWEKGSRGCYSKTSVLSPGGSNNSNGFDDEDNDGDEYFGKKGKKKARAAKKAKQKAKKSQRKEEEQDESSSDWMAEAVEPAVNELEAAGNISSDASSLAVEDGEALSEIFPQVRSSGVGRSCHCTVMTAQGVESRETNFDILQLCDIERSQGHHISEFVDVKHGKAKYYGDGFCCIYFNKPLKVNSLFSGYY